MEPAATTTRHSLLDTSIRKRSVRLFGHLTSISLEQPFWRELQRLAEQQGCSLTALIQQIDSARTEPAAGRLRGNLSSAIRLYVLAAISAERDAALAASGQIQPVESDHG